jgi:hypothetical protein
VVGVNDHLRELRQAADAACGGHWTALQAEMRATSIDALVLSQPGACYFAAGHERVAVMGGGAGAPAVIVPPDGQPHVWTTNPDGALALDEHHVHAQSWNPALVMEQIRSWIPQRDGVRIGFDVVSPGVLTRVSKTFGSVEAVDANDLVSSCMLVKSDAEVHVLALLCALVHDAVLSGDPEDSRGLYDRLGGAVPSLAWRFSAAGVVLGVSYRGFAAEARVGPADPRILEDAIDTLVPGRTVSEVTRLIPEGVEIVGIGRGYEAPYLSHGRAWPNDLVLVPNAVVVVRNGEAAVTVRITGSGAELLSPSPREVASVAARSA